MKEASFCL